MQKLYFIRHGETQDNVDERWPRPDVPLTAAGRKQAAVAGQQAKASGLRFDAIVVSPLPRAQETARLIAAEIGFPEDRIETLPLLTERDMGELVGVHTLEFFPPGTTRTYKDIDTVPDAETIEQVQVRAQQVLDALRQRPEHTILVVSHGIFGRAFRRAVLGIPYTDEYAEPRPRNMIPNATIIELI